MSGVPAIPCLPESGRHYGPDELGGTLGLPCGTGATTGEGREVNELLNAPTASATRLRAPMAPFASAGLAASVDPGQGQRCSSALVGSVSPIPGVLLVPCSAHGLVGVLRQEAPAPRALGHGLELPQHHSFHHLQVTLSQPAGPSTSTATQSRGDEPREHGTNKHPWCSVTHEGQDREVTLSTWNVPGAATQGEGS